MDELEKKYNDLKKKYDELEKKYNELINPPKKKSNSEPPGSGWSDWDPSFGGADCDCITCGGLP